MDSKPWTTLFVDGNHENFYRLEKYPTMSKYGGKVQKISKKVFHLLRGEIYTIENKKIFTFGGAFSHDQFIRKKYVNWWEQELPTQKECEYALENLKKHENSVDIVITHDCPKSLALLLGYDQDAMSNGYSEERVNILTFLEHIKTILHYRDWYCGYYHRDEDIQNIHFLFNRVLNEETKEDISVLTPLYQLGEEVIFYLTKEKDIPRKGIIIQIHPRGYYDRNSGIPEYDIESKGELTLDERVLHFTIKEAMIEKIDKF